MPSEVRATILRFEQSSTRTMPAPIGPLNTWLARYACPLYGLLLLYFRNDHRIFPPYSFRKYVKYVELNNMNSGMRKLAPSPIYSLRRYAPCFDISLLPATADWASIGLVKYYRRYNHKSFGDPIPLLDLPIPLLALLASV